MSLMSECEVLYNSQSVSAFYGSFHTTVTRWAQFKINNTQSPARLLSSIYLEIDAFWACLVQGIGHREFLSIYTRIQEQYKQFGTLRAKGECPLSSSLAGYRKVLKSYFTCSLTGEISQNVDSNPKPQHSSVHVFLRAPTREQIMFFTIKEHSIYILEILYLLN